MSGWKIPNGKHSFWFGSWKIVPFNLIVCFLSLAFWGWEQCAGSVRENISVPGPHENDQEEDESCPENAPSYVQWNGNFLFQKFSSSIFSPFFLFFYLWTQKRNEEALNAERDFSSILVVTLSDAAWWSQISSAQSHCKLIFFSSINQSNALLLYHPAGFGHFLDPPGNHPRGAIFPTVDPS